MECTPVQGVLRCVLSTADVFSKPIILLFNRIREHFRNIQQAENLFPNDFKCRYIILDGDESGIIGPVEAHLIRKSQPLWNAIIDGFGNHTPREGRFNQAKSGWDVLHPGRGDVWESRLIMMIR